MFAHLRRLTSVVQGLATVFRLSLSFLCGDVQGQARGRLGDRASSPASTMVSSSLAWSFMARGYRRGVSVAGSSAVQLGLSAPALE